jgi:hypothetical protein
MSGNTFNDGGGTPERMPSGNMLGTRLLVELSEARWPGMTDGKDPPATNTAEGMA